MCFLAIHHHKKGTNVLILNQIFFFVTMDITFFTSQSFFNTPLQGENVCEDSFEIDNNGGGCIKNSSLINSGLPLLDSRTLNLEVGLPNAMPTYGLEIGIYHDTRTRENKLFWLVYSRNK